MAATSKRMNGPMVAAGWMMCGRMVLTRSANEVAEYFGAEPLEGESAFGPRFNVAPSQPILAVRQEEGGSLSLARSTRSPAACVEYRKLNFKFKLFLELPR